MVSLVFPANAVFIIGVLPWYLLANFKR